MSFGRLETFPRLVGDIGGTNARLAIVADAGRPPTRIRTLPCAQFAGPVDAIEAYLALENIPCPKVASIGIANPVTADAVAMTNHAWQFSVRAVREALGLERLLLVNDFTALALALPHLPASELHQIGGTAAEAGQAIALLGPGTGLGISGLVPTPSGPVPVSGEGGHVTMPACNRREAQLLARLEEQFGHVSAERILSGPGLQALHHALGEVDGEAPIERTAADIAGLAQTGEDARCIEALEMFCAMLGTVAGNLALTLGAKGGVYIGGGIVPKLGNFFKASSFRTRFEAKGRFTHYLANIPVFVIHTPFAALDGASHALDTPPANGYDDRGLTLTDH